MDVRRATEPDMSTDRGIDMNSVLGPLFWGTLVSMIFTGTTILQAYRYFPSKDRPAIQLVALSMLLLDLLSSALAVQGLHYYLLPHFGSTLPLGHLVPTLAVECVAATCIIAISQLYFAWQVYALAQKPFVKYIVSTTVAVLSLVAFAGGLVCSFVMFVHSTNILTTRNRTFNETAGLAKAPAALVDIIVTCSLCYSLGYVKTGVRATDSVLKTLIGFVIKRGVVVTLIQAAFLVMFYMPSRYPYWLGLHVNVTRMYANTFFAMLNGRETLREELPTKFFVASGLGSRNHADPENISYVLREGPDGGYNATEVPPSWMNTVNGKNSADALRIAQIQVDQKVMVSNI